MATRVRSGAQARLEEWRGRILTVLLRVTALSSTALLALVPEFYRRGALGLAFGGPWLWLAIMIAAFTRGHDRARARVYVYCTTLTLLLGLPSTGPTGGVATLVALAAVTGVLLLGTREAVGVLSVILVSLVGWWVAIRFGFYSRPLTMNADMSDPRVAGRVVFVVAVSMPLLVVATGYLIRRLTESVIESEELVHRLRSEMEAREAETRRREATERQLFEAQRMEALGRLAGGVAHDVNNNMQVAITNAELIAERPMTTDQVRRLATDIRGACESAAALTRQLLTVGRRDVTRPARVAPAAAFEKLARSLTLFTKDRITVRLVASDEVPDVLVDASQLEQVLLNLAINACDAMPGSGNLTIEVEHGGPSPRYDFASSPTEPADVVRIHVRDSGVGVPSERLPRIFEPFFTTKEAGRGTGLGLALALAFAERSGGRIGVRSAPGSGSTFTLELPAMPPRAPIGEREAASSQLGKTILVVDDDPRVRAIEEGVLRDAGYDVLVAEDVKTALEIASQHARIDLLCTDAVMPGEGGEILVERFRELYPSTRVLVCSGYVGSPALRDFIERGHFLVVTKPFAPETLRRAVAEALAAPDEPDRAPS